MDGGPAEKAVKSGNKVLRMRNSLAWPVVRSRQPICCAAQLIAIARSFCTCIKDKRSVEIYDSALQPANFRYAYIRVSTGDTDSRDAGPFPCPKAWGPTDRFSVTGWAIFHRSDMHRHPFPVGSCCPGLPLRQSPMMPTASSRYCYDRKTRGRLLIARMLSWAACVAHAVPLACPFSQVSQEKVGFGFISQ